MSIVSLNLSLMINQVGFYQVSCSFCTVSALHDVGLRGEDLRTDFPCNARADVRELILVLPAWHRA